MKRDRNLFGGGPNSIRRKALVLNPSIALLSLNCSDSRTRTTKILFEIEISLSWLLKSIVTSLRVFFRMDYYVCGMAQGIHLRTRKFQYFNYFKHNNVFVRCSYFSSLLLMLLVSSSSSSSSSSFFFLSMQSLFADKDS